MNKDMTYEMAHKQLEDIVAKMEKGDVPLTECMTLYEQAYTLLDFCTKKLEQCKGQITDINERIGMMKEETDSLFID